MPHFWLFVLIFFAAVPLYDLATPVVPWDDMKINHTWNVTPVNWETLGHPSAGSTIDINIVLKPYRESALIDAVSEISDPKHSRHGHLTIPPLAPSFTCAFAPFRYRAFLSKEQVYELVRPSPHTVYLVSAWLAHNGIPSSSISRTHGGTWFTVSDLRVTLASQLLGASYQLYRNMNTNETIIRTPVGYSPPEVLHPHVQTVMPATCFSSMEVTVQTPHRCSFGPAPVQMQAASGKLGTVEARQPPPGPVIVEPENLRWLYGTVEYVPAAYGPGKNTLAVIGDRLPSQQDLTHFMTKYQERDADRATFNTVPVDGIPPNLGELPDERSNVAVQYATAMAYPTPLFAFRIVRTENAFLELVDYLTHVQPIPRTISISFNYFFEQQIPPSDADYVCERFGYFGARGASVLVASGNNGVGAPGGCDRPGFASSFPHPVRATFITPPNHYIRASTSHSPDRVSQVPGSRASAALKT